MYICVLYAITVYNNDTPWLLALSSRIPAFHSWPEEVRFKYVQWGWREGVCGSAVSQALPWLWRGHSTGKPQRRKLWERERESRRKYYQCKNGIRNWGRKAQLYPGSKGLNMTIRQILGVGATKWLVQPSVELGEMNDGYFRSFGLYYQHKSGGGVRWLAMLGSLDPIELEYKTNEKMVHWTIWYLSR
jgi:hypothetical protein